MGTLTRKEMEDVIRGGGSVLHKGQILTHLSHLPSEADLALGNPEQEAAASAALEAQIQTLMAAKAKLDLAHQSPIIGPAHPAAAPTPAATTTEPDPFDPHAEKATKKHAADTGKG